MAKAMREDIAESIKKIQKTKAMILQFQRAQTVEVELLREPTLEEMKILLGKDENASMFDLENIIDWDKEEIINEDHSFETFVKLEKPKLI